MDIKKVGVIGIGTMGHGITQVCAQAGYDTLVVDTTQDFINRGMANINSNLQKSVEKGKMTDKDKAAIMGHIKTSTDMKALADRDLIVEAVFESLDLKKQIFKELEKVCRKDAILGSNSSCLSIIDIAMQTSRPEKVVGLHFFVPATMMPLLEIVKTIATGDDVMEDSKKFGTKLGKTCVIAKDTPGFVVNALLVPFLLDAIRMYEAGIASREDIDAGMRLGANHPMGPLALCDFIGIDVVKFIADSMYEQVRLDKWVAPVLLQKMVSAGRLGRKTGSGFYVYNK